MVIHVTIIPTVNALKISIPFNVVFSKKIRATRSGIYQKLVGIAYG